MVMACLDNLTEIRVDGQPKVGVQCDPLELLHFIGRDFVPLNLICERAGMFEDRIYLRTKAVFEYFGLPFQGVADGAISPLARQ